MAPSVLAQAYNSYHSAADYKASYVVNLFGEGTADQSLRIYDIFSENLVTLTMDFVPHTITRVSENIIVCTNKYGVKAAIIDLKKGKIVHSHVYSSDDQMQYMGHCLFDP